MSSECDKRRMRMELIPIKGGYKVSIGRDDEEEVSRWSTSAYTTFHAPDDVNCDAVEYKLYVYVDHTFDGGQAGREECQLRGDKELNLCNGVKLECLVPDLNRGEYVDWGDTTVGVVLRREGEIIARLGQNFDNMSWTKQTPEQINRSGAFMTLLRVGNNASKGTQCTKV